MGCACFRSNLIIKSKIKDSNTNELNSSYVNNINSNNGNNINTNNNNNINSENIYSSSSNNNRVSSSINNLESNNSNNNNNNIQNYYSPNFEPYLQSKHNENFNYPELQNEFIGKGLKQMKGYISHKTLEDLIKIREDFWSSRIEGDREIWDILKNICNDNSLSDDDINGILKASGIVPYKNCINIVFDSKGFLYEIPNYCINFPSKYKIEEIEYDKKKPEEEKINIIIRYYTKQIKSCVSNWKNIFSLKEDIIQLNDYKKIKVDRIKLFFGGKELYNDKELWFYNFQNKSICQMLIKEEEKKENEKFENNIEEKDNKEILKQNDTGLEEVKISEKNPIENKLDSYINNTLIENKEDL